MNNNRDYNKEFQDTEDHKYAYNFDFDVMHPFMLQSFIPFFKEGNIIKIRQKSPGKITFKTS